MFQVPAGIWQEIAAYTDHQTRWAKAMAGGQEAINLLLEQVSKEQRAQGIPTQVRLAFQVVAPLLVEYEAVQKWARATESLNMLPDLPTPEIAARVGAMEYDLTPEQEANLESLLSKELGVDLPPTAGEHEDAARGYELLVDRGHFTQGLKAFRVPRKLRSSARAILGFDGSYFTVEAFDQMFVARATGVWPGNAHVSATLVAALMQAPPPGDPLVVRCDGAKVSIGSMRIDCQWQPVSQALTTAPAARDWIAALALRYLLPRGRIVTEGLAKEVEDAEHKLALLVAKVSKSLAPLGVTAEDLRSLVETRLRERYLASEDANPARPENTPF